MDIYDTGRRIHVRARRNEKRRRLHDSICLNDFFVDKALNMDKYAIGVPTLFTDVFKHEDITSSFNGSSNASIKSIGTSVSVMGYSVSSIESYKYDT